MPYVTVSNSTEEFTWTTPTSVTARVYVSPDSYTYTFSCSHTPEVVEEKVAVVDIWSHFKEKF